MPENVVQNIKNISLSAFSCQPDTSKALHWCLLRIIPLALLADVGILFNKNKRNHQFQKSQNFHSRQRQWSQLWTQSFCWCQILSVCLMKLSGTGSALAVLLKKEEFMSIYLGFQLTKNLIKTCKATNLYWFMCHVFSATLLPYLCKAIHQRKRKTSLVSMKTVYIQPLKSCISCLPSRYPLSKSSYQQYSNIQLFLFNIVQYATAIIFLLKSNSRVSLGDEL